MGICGLSICNAPMSALFCALSGPIGSSERERSNLDVYKRQAIKRNDDVVQTLYDRILGRVALNDVIHPLTVSYTHLDVYKRQPLRRVSPRKRPSRSRLSLRRLVLKLSLSSIAA